MKTFGEIGHNFSRSQKVQYFSNQTLLDFDYLIVDIDSVLSPMDANVLLENDVYKRMINRRTDMQEFVDVKKVPIVCFVPSPYEVSFDTPDGIYEREGIHFLPCDYMPIEAATGMKIDVKPKTIMTELLTTQSKWFRYTSFFEEFSGMATGVVPHKNLVVAGYTKNIIFLPALKERLDPLEAEGFFDKLLTVLEGFNKKSNITDFPDWTGRYLLKNERESMDNLATIERKLVGLELEKIKALQNLEVLQSQKLLFTASGINLENVVRDVLENIGFNILPSISNKDDIIASYNGRIVVVEVKGVAGSAAQKYTRQLENWVTDYAIENDVTPKGILVINTYRDIELEERKDDDFPNQMIDYSVKREHCLLTTLQLMGLQQAIQSNPEKKEELIESLFNTNGVYQGFKDWREYIEVDDKTSL